MARYFHIISVVLTLFPQLMSMLYIKFFCIPRIKSQQCRFICTDFLRAMQSLNGYACDSPLTTEIQIQVCHLYKAEQSVLFGCVPGHKADVVVKAATLHRSCHI